MAIVETQKTGQILVTATNSLRVLTLFCDENPELGVTEISKKLGLAKSTVSRMLTTLVDESILARDDDSGRYRLGPLLLELGLVVSELNPVVSNSESVLQSLRDATEESAYLLLRDGCDSVCAASYESKGGAHVRTGVRLPLADSVCGMTILAFLEGDEFDNALRYYAANHCAFPPQYMENLGLTLAEIQNNGHAFHEERKSSGLITVACPIFTPRGAVVAAVAVTSPAQRFTQSTQSHILHAVSKAAQQISRKLPS